MGWYSGAVYRIGELANLANVSKRTIDYYTGLGLLNAKRSKGNYRIYPEDALDDLKTIENYKKVHLPLHEIKGKLELKNHTQLQNREVENQLKRLAIQMKQLNNDLSMLLPIIQKYKHDSMSNKLNEEGSALIESLERMTYD
jgi:MerR family transcriptional regulator, copper efflux regulator